MTETDKICAAPETQLGNLKVLLAEDNEVNQLLAKNILHHWGLQWKIATDGYQVMELLNAEDFDIVLMDIQMPGKSGIEAAHDIRQLADLKKKNIPIIALTANALKGEEKKYQAVGMDDFLTKPFKREDLFEVIVKVLESRKDNCSCTTVKTPFDKTGFAPMEKLYDLSYIQELGGNNADFINSLLQIFIDTTPADSAEMVKACTDKKWDAVSKLAHKIKSTIDSLRITEIKDDVRTIELDAKNKVNLDAVARLVAKVDRVVNETAVQLSQELQK